MGRALRSVLPLVAGTVRLLFAAPWSLIAAFVYLSRGMCITGWDCHNCQVSLDPEIAVGSWTPALDRCFV